MGNLLVTHEILEKDSYDGLTDQAAAAVHEGHHA